MVEDDDVDAVLRVGGSGVSAVGVVGGPRQPSGDEVKDSRLGRCGDVRPGRSVT